MNIDTLEHVDVLASSYDGKPLNSPNDLMLDLASAHVYFTDPYYGLLENHRFYDHNYTDLKSAIGHAGVYRVALPEAVGDAEHTRPELLIDELERPNGIQLEPGDEGAVWVSECCQGHSPTCPPATARWHRFVPPAADDFDRRYERNATIEWEKAGGGRGCADGFKLLPRGPELSPLIVGSCPYGVCVVDTGTRKVVQYLPFGAKRVSNVAFGAGWLYVTGDRLWRIRLTDEAAAWAADAASAAAAAAAAASRASAKRSASAHSQSASSSSNRAGKDEL